MGMLVCISFSVIRTQVICTYDRGMQCVYLRNAQYPLVSVTERAAHGLCQHYIRINTQQAEKP